MRPSPFQRGCSLPATVATVGFMICLAACDDTPTTAVLDNAFPVAPATPVTIYKAWWITTLFSDAVPPGSSSVVQRTVPGSDHAYALLAPGWSPDDQGPPPRLVAVKSAAPLAVSAHDVLHIAVDDTFVGDCAAGSTLTADDASLIVERIFPGAFTGATYDPATCTTTPATGAGGAGGAGHEAAGGAGGASP